MVGNPEVEPVFPWSIGRKPPSRQEPARSRFRELRRVYLGSVAGCPMGINGWVETYPYRPALILRGLCVGVKTPACQPGPAARWSFFAACFAVAGKSVKMELP